MAALATPRRVGYDGGGVGVPIWFIAGTFVMTSTSTATAPDPPTRNRGPFIIAMMVLAALLFLATAGLLYVRWATTVEPNCELIVSVGPALRGAEISVDGMTLPTAHRVTIGAENRFSQAFFLDPGTYDIKVTLNNELQFSTSVTMRPWTEGTLDLTKVVPTTQPAAEQPARR